MPSVWSVFFPFSFFSVYIISLTRPRGSISRYACLILLVWTATSIFSSTFSLENSVADFTLSSFVVGFLLNAFAWTFITDTPTFLKDQPAPQLSFSRAILLTITPRGIGWSHGTDSVLPPRPRGSKSRGHFVAKMLGIGLANGLAVDLLQAYMWNVPRFHIGGAKIADFPFGFSRFFNVIVFGLSAATSMSTVYYFSSAFCVCTNISEPEDCPAFFGSPLHAYSLAGFWGRTWHQLFRPIVMPYAHLTARICGFKRGTRTYHLAILYAAFILSALVHQAGDYKMHRGWRAGGSYIFFPIQALGITLETIIAPCVPDIIPKRVKKAFGYAWVFAWFTWTAPVYVDPLFNGGLLDNGPGFSFTLGVWRGEWFLQPSGPGGIHASSF